MIWVVACTFGTLGWIIYPLFSTVEKVLGLKSWYPFNIHSSPGYEIAFILQLFGQLYVGIGYGIWSGIFMSMVIMCCGQFDILFASLKNLGEMSSVKNLTELR